jgi:xylulokinase
MITLGIDVGTTRTKVLALDVETGQTVAQRAAPTPVTHAVSGESRDAGEVLAVAIGLLAEVAAALPDRQAVSALAVASVGEEVVLLDDTGSPIGETIAWYDPRGQDQAHEFMAGAGGEVALSRQWPPDPTFSLFKLMWTRDQRPQEWAAASTWTDLGDFVLRGLGAEVVMDWTHASRAGAFDLVKRSWDDETIEAAQLRIAFPRLVPSGSVVGTLDPVVAARVGLSRDLRLVSGGHDHLCAALGAGLRSRGDVVVSAGTSAAHLVLVDAPLADSDHRAAADQGCYVDAETYYVHVNIHSGHFYSQWRELLYADVDDADMYAEMAAVSLSDGPTFELLEGQRLGRLDQIDYDAGRAQIMRAVLEGLARRSADIVVLLGQASGRASGRIIAAGHPPQVPLWREIRERHYGRSLVVESEAEIAALGAARLAATAK